MSATVRPIRRRRRRSLVVLMRVYALAIIVALILFSIAAYFFVTAPVFRVHSVTVTPSTHVSVHEIRAAAAIQPSANVWLLNTQAIAGRIEAIPYVRTATVRRALPAHVSIAVQERADFACVAAPSGRATIDEFGRDLHDGCASALPILHSSTGLVLAPGAFVSDAAVRRMIGDDQRLRGVIPIRSLAVGMFDSLEAVTTTGIRVQFGPDDAQLEPKAALVAPIVAEAKRHGRRVRTLDLRSGETPVVTYAPESPAQGTACCRRTSAKPNI